jgi:hypothetical protein
MVAAEPDCNSPPQYQQHFSRGRVVPSAAVSLSSVGFELLRHQRATSWGWARVLNSINTFFTNDLMFAGVADHGAGMGRADDAL